MIEHCVAEGQQVFTISWRNPEQAQGHFDLDTYADAVAEARAAVASIAAQSKVNLAAACSGGIITAGLLGHLAAGGELGEVETLTLMVCALDNDTEGTMSALASRDVAAAAVAESARKGYLDWQALAGVFTWLRPNDLVWNYLVNNYLLGKAPPAFDILYWNQDTVRLAAGLHRDFIHIGLDNAFVHPGALEVLGDPVDIDTYCIAGLSDHIVPWESAYKGARLFGGKRRFVLSKSGPIQALVNPPSPESRSSYQVADELPEEPETFFAQAPKLAGSWWPDWDAWLAERSGELGPGPEVTRQRRPQGKGEGARNVRPCRLNRTPDLGDVPASELPPLPDGRWWGDHLRETRWQLELYRLLVDPIFRGQGVPHGDGRPVILLPGFGGGDQTLLVLAAWLRRIGYRPRLCGFVANLGCSDRAVDRVELRLEELHRRHRRRVALVGHSRGGHYARDADAPRRRRHAAPRRRRARAQPG
jgi:hypothetical protein